MSRYQVLFVRVIGGASTLCLVVLGYLGAQAGDAPVGFVLRIASSGVLAMLFTAAVGGLFGAAVS